MAMIQIGTGFVVVRFPFTPVHGEIRSNDVSTLQSKKEHGTF